MNDNDILKEFMSPGEKEKAPDGFTGRVMNRVLLERKLKRSESLLSRIKVLLTASSSVAFLITLAAIFTSPSGYKLFPGINSILPELKIDFYGISDNFLSNLKIPSLAIYILAGLVLLFLLDYIISRMMQREL